MLNKRSASLKSFSGAVVLRRPSFCKICHRNNPLVVEAVSPCNLCIGHWFDCLGLQVATAFPWAKSFFMNYVRPKLSRFEFANSPQPVYSTVSSISAETNSLHRFFEPDGYYGASTDKQEALPGFIPYITDFSHIVCFAIAGGGEHFCFDFREDATCPSVVWWDDSYWRRVAPDFQSFIELFDCDSGG